ncbi:MAG TPA: orotidine-5'-phosphate decarboxylase [Chthonomonadales bacterium]|nr:orotidine-5'-phosphate decarboxylase [Chthonomonadales bacterium]
MKAEERIVCALDVGSANAAIDLVSKLRGHVGAFKVGLELMNAEGAQIVERLRQEGAARIFYDAKMLDIPNTVAGAMRGVVRLGAWCVTIHASGGSAILKTAVATARDEAARLGVPPPKILGVTVLTSIAEPVLRNELKVAVPLLDLVTHLACLARDAGCDGVVVSPLEVEAVRKAVGTPDFLIITPGVRPEGSAAGDQARTMTPAQAIHHGADYLVIGRPITGATDPVYAAQHIAAQIANAFDFPRD